MAGREQHATKGLTACADLTGCGLFEREVTLRRRRIGFAGDEPTDGRLVPHAGIGQ
jgi:hypothetical protein